MAGIFTTAYNKSAAIEKAVNGLRVCGLWPFNDQIFDEEDFIEAGVTAEPNPAAESTQWAHISSHLMVRKII